MSTPASLAEAEWAIKAYDKAAVSAPAAYDKYAGGRHEPWCAWFASWIFAKVNQPLPGYKPPSPTQFADSANCSYLFNRLSEKGLIKSSPKRNDLIFYKHSNPQYPSGHVGIVTEVKDGKVTSVEGNLSNMVAKATHLLSDPKIAGYGRVYTPGLPLVGLAALGGSFWLTLRYLQKNK